MAGKSGSISSRTKGDRRARFAERQGRAGEMAAAGMKETAALAGNLSHQRARQERAEAEAASYYGGKGRPTSQAETAADFHRLARGARPQAGLGEPRRSDRPGGGGRR